MEPAVLVEDMFFADRGTVLSGRSGNRRRCSADLCYLLSNRQFPADSVEYYCHTHPAPIIIRTHT